MEETTKLKDVTVIIPMYNSEESIERSILSVVNQSYNGLIEIIVINDGSKDKSVELVNDFILKYPNFNIKLISQENGGVSMARNVGLKIAKGTYIAFLDADDAWLPEKLKIQIDFFEANKTIDFLGASFYGFGVESKKDGRLSKITLSNLLFKNYFQPSTVIFKREILQTIGYFDENQRYAEEGNFFMRVAKNFSCFFVNKNLIIFGNGKAGFGESGLSANLKEMEKGELKNLKFVYENGWINPAVYAFAVLFSLLKYLRRILIVKMR